MEIIRNYADLCRKIDIIEEQIYQVDIDIDYWFGKGKFPFTGTGANDFGIIASMGNIEQYNAKKYRLLKMLEFYRDTKKAIEKKVNEMEGLPYKIARMKYIENKTYKEIANELNKSYGYIRRVASESNKEVTK